MAAPVVEYNSPVAHGYILASLSLEVPPLCQPSERPQAKAAFQIVPPPHSSELTSLLPVLRYHPAPLGWVHPYL